MKHTIHASHAGSGESDIVLIPQPTECGGDPLVRGLYLSFCVYEMFQVLTVALEMVEMEEILPALPRCAICLRVLFRREYAWR